MRVLEPLLKVGEGDQLAGSASEQNDIDMSLSYNLGFTPIHIYFRVSIGNTTHQVIQGLTTNLSQGALSIDNLEDDPQIFASYESDVQIVTSGFHTGSYRDLYFMAGDLVLAQNIRWARSNGAATVVDIGFGMYYKLVELTNAEVATLVARSRS